jgi:hypothetical protein
MEQPVFIGVDAVPAALLTCSKEEQNARARATWGVRRAKGLTKETALGVANQPEGGDHFFSSTPCGRCVHRAWITIIHARFG